jgi:hypothetical protein
MTAATPPDLNTKMTERGRTVWSQGDFARAGAEQVIVGELLACDVRPTSPARRPSCCGSAGPAAASA